MESNKNDWVSRNVMEVLVAEEIHRQIDRCPENVKKHINRIEVSTYALNRLPALYASSQQGFNKQKLKGRSEYSVQITKTVRQAFAAIQKDLLRYSTPLTSNLDDELDEARNALSELAEFFPNGDISWANLVKLVKPILLEHNIKYRKLQPSEKIQCQASAMWKESAF
jgi:hypothetical protein